MEHRDAARERDAADRQPQISLGCAHDGERRTRGEQLQVVRPWAGQVEGARDGDDVVNASEIGVAEIYDQARGVGGGERCGRPPVHPFDHQALLGGAAERDGGRVEVGRCGPEGADEAVDREQRAGGDPALIERAGVDRVGGGVGYRCAGAGEVEAGGREVADRQDIEHGAPGGRGAQRAPDTGGSEARLAGCRRASDHARGRVQAEIACAVDAALAGHIELLSDRDRGGSKPGRHDTILAHGGGAADRDRGVVVESIGICSAGSAQALEQMRAAHGEGVAAAGAHDSGDMVCEGLETGAGVYRGGVEAGRDAGHIPECPVGCDRRVGGEGSHGGESRGARVGGAVDIEIGVGVGAHGHRPHGG